MDTVEDWQRKLAEQVADSYVDGVPLHINWARRYGKLVFRDALDAEMTARGWTVLAPGVYRAPADSA